MANVNQNIVQPQFDNDPLMRRYYELQVLRMEREEQERVEEEKRALQAEQKKAANRLRDAQEAEERRKALERAQNNCAHKCGYKSAVRGQRLGGDTHFIFCQLCMKEWPRWEVVPGDLHIEKEYYGGPQGW